MAGDYDYNSGYDYFLREDNKFYLNEIKRISDELNYIKSHQSPPIYHQIMKSPDDELWDDIRTEAATNPGLADLLAQAKAFYFLSKK